MAAYKVLAPDVQQELETKQGAQVWLNLAWADPASVQLLAGTCREFRDMLINVAWSCEGNGFQVPGFPTAPDPFGDLLGDSFD